MTRSWKFLLLAGLMGCYKINYTNGSEYNSKGDSIKWHHTAVAGVVEISQPVPLDYICPDGWGRVHHQRSPLNLASSYAAAAVIVPVLNAVPVSGEAAMAVRLLSFAPSMIYTPSSVTVHCKSGTAYRIPATQEALDAMLAGAVTDAASPE